MTLALKGRGRFWVREIPQGEIQSLAPGCDIQTMVKDCPTLPGVLSVYYATQAPGMGPYADLGQHAEDEIIIPLSGELAVIDEARTRRIGPGSLLHIPTWGLHNLPCVGDAEARFFVLKLLARDGEAPEADRDLVTLAFDELPLGPGVGLCQRGESVWRCLADGSRLRIGKFFLEGGYGYPLHSHDHDLILVLLNGRLHGIGHDTKGPAIIYYPAGCPHAVSPTPEGAEFISIELHAPSRHD
jgi:quercetin dioxygenase-like cupin family protein